MNYHSKILSLFIGIFAFATILSCNDCDPKNYTCTYDSFRTTNLKITKYSNGNISSQGTFSDSLLKDSFGIFLSFHYANPRSNYGMGDAFGIIPFNSPSFTGLQSFQVKVKLSDGRNFTSISDTIFLY